MGVSEGMGKGVDVVVEVLVGIAVTVNVLGAVGGIFVLVGEGSGVDPHADTVMQIRSVIRASFLLDIAILLR